MPSAVAAPGQLIAGRYRLERLLSPAEADGQGQGLLWLASDQLAAEAPLALRQLPTSADQARIREIWSRLQGVLHPQVPRLGAAVTEAGQLWLVREWQAGRTYQQLLRSRAERQLVFGAGEVLLLLRQLLPVLAALHSQDLIHGDLSPANLLRRDRDGLPVLLDFGLLCQVGGAAEPAPRGATPGYAPPELLQGEPAQPWMDLHALGVVALVLLSGDEPAALLDPVTMAWRWPAALEQEPALADPLRRLLSRDPGRRFASAGQALLALQAVEMPESTGPVPRADRTVVLVPPDLPAEPPAQGGGAASGDSSGDHAEGDHDGATQDATDHVTDDGFPGDGFPGDGFPDDDIDDDTDDRDDDRDPAAGAAPYRRTGQGRPRSRFEDREEAAEGGLWPVLIALVISAVAGTAIGWWWLGRDRLAPPEAGPAAVDQPSSLPPAEVDQRQQLLNRLRALQVDRAWFLSLVDAALMAQYPERRGRLPSDSVEDAALRKVWNDLAEEWLARVEQLPLALRRRLGSFNSGDWERRQQGLVGQGLSPSVLRQLVSGSAQNLLPGRVGEDLPPEPFRQLWYAAAELTLDHVSIAPIVARARTIQELSAEVPANGARLFPIRLPEGHSLALGVNGTPLLQMTVFAADGSVLEAKGQLRVVTLGPQKSSPVQLLISNEGVAPALIRLSLRADPPVAAPEPAAPPAGAPPAAPEGPPPLSPPPVETPSSSEAGTPEAAPPAAAPAAPANP
jgi:serine/threonine-protein kinase